jgi:hypothetical protein
MNSIPIKVLKTRLLLFVLNSIKIGSLLQGPKQKTLVSLTPQGCLRPGIIFKSIGLMLEIKYGFMIPTRIIHRQNS